MSIINYTLDEIKDTYKYEIDISDNLKTVNRINDFFIVKFEINFEKYNFEERILKLTETLEKRKNKIDKETLVLYENNLKDIKEITQKTIKELNDEYRHISRKLYSFTVKCEENLDKLGMLDVYNKLGKEMLDKEAEKYIRYEKLFLSFNDIIIDINNKLNSNF